MCQKPHSECGGMNGGKIISWEQKWDSYSCHINYLHVNGTVLVPQLGYPELDKEACAQINEAFSQVKDRSCVRLICVDMTHVVAEMNDFFNSGGALNCLTWTILSKQDIADRALPDGWSG